MCVSTVNVQANEQRDRLGISDEATEIVLVSGLEGPCSNGACDLEELDCITKYRSLLSVFAILAELACFRGLDLPTLTTCLNE